MTGRQNACQAGSCLALKWGWVLLAQMLWHSWQQEDSAELPPGTRLSQEGWLDKLEEKGQEANPVREEMTAWPSGVDVCRPGACPLHPGAPAGPLGAAVTLQKGR